MRQLVIVLVTLFSGCIIRFQEPEPPPQELLWVGAISQGIVDILDSIPK